MKGFGLWIPKMAFILTSVLGFKTYEPKHPFLIKTPKK